MTYEICLEFPGGRPAQAEVVRCVLAGLGVSDTDIAEQDLNGRVRLSFFVPSKKYALSLKRKILRARLTGISCLFIPLKAVDWQTRWKEDFKSFAITRGLYVVPLWEQKGWKKQDRPALFIDTDTVFGTGMHPTTRFMAEFIDGKKGHFEDFLDIGTGTGILALVAWNCGAHSISCIDISKDAVAAAKKNFRNNDCFPEYIKEIDFACFKPEEKFDFVAANLLTEDLIDLKKRLIACVRPGKYLAVSGISLANYGEFRRRFDTRRIRCLRVIKRKGWAAVLYTVKNHALRRAHSFTGYKG